MTLTILDGSTFCICADDGAITEGAHGFYADDTRFLSRLAVRINGERPIPLSAGKVEYFAAAFFLRNPPLGVLRADELLIRSERFVTDDLQEHIVVSNLAGDGVSIELSIELASDFADILSIKHHDFALGDPELAGALPPPVALVAGTTPQTAQLLDPGGVLGTHVRSSRVALVAGSALWFALELGPHAEWDVRLTFRPRTGRARPGRTPRARHFGEQRSRIKRSLQAWNLHVPSLQTSWGDLGQAYGRSVSDLAALRMRGSDGVGLLPAAGMPWFMTVFGRDTVITCLQTLPFGSELASTALRVLAELQAEHDDPSIDAEPGKIIHELRRGRAAEVWFERYYGTADATPLFLVLLSETWRWTGDDALVRELEPAMRKALRWIDEFGDLDGDGFVEFRRRSEHGLVVQSWKDSPDSQRFADGRIAEAPIAACEVQGYVYDAKRRCAELARAVLGDEALAARLERDAAELRERFDRAFWVERSGGFYALALDRRKRQVDSRCSNMGHLLWSGIVPDARVAAVTRTLFAPALWSGWGVRTMSAEDEAYRPLGYHNGTVWPHDNSLIALGLALCGETDASLRIVRSMIEAARFFDGGLPEVFAGLARRDTPFPVAYPTASRPQAWAAGAPVLLLRVLLGLEADHLGRTLSVRADGLPRWAGDLSLTGIPAFGMLFDAHLRGGRVEVVEATEDSSAAVRG
ncbi:MAG TPA: glycogen debranching N-terminal domain-containing protein [Gaiellales bacterium]|jgi:glycogen debranching enzyme|nr:glycogen debranching N-terminal domain-containing protein [Gaiellales bacterium]